MNHSFFLVRFWLPLVAIGATLAAQDPTIPSVLDRDHMPRQGQALPAFAGAAAIDHVLFDQPGDGKLWAAGPTYKASFGADGFVYVPFLGSSAPRNYPVQFKLRAVRVNGRAIEYAASAAATRDGTRVSFDRGAVREIYDLAKDSIEQTFIIDGDQAGDVEVELEIITELGEDIARDGLQFGNQLGEVSYGTAYLVHDAIKTEIPTAFAGRTLRLRVPAAQRSSGPVVIDPIITTKTFAPTQMASEVPDIAYDVDTDRWLVTWIHIFSANDHDVLAELRDANGDPVPGSLKFIDTTMNSMSYPRVANLGVADRFLIAMEKIPQVVGEVFSVWGRTMDARTPFSTNNLFEISPPSGLHQNNVDVGGEPGVFGTHWAVVWVIGKAIYARRIRADGTPENTLIPVSQNGSAQCINPQISLSNGRGQAGLSGWCIVYDVQVSAVDWNVWAVPMAPNGTFLKAPRRLAGGSTNDLYPSVSSPVVDRSAGPLFMVSYERQTATNPEMIVQVIDMDLNTVVPEVNLSRRYGYSGTFCRVESDGVRFAAISRIGSDSLAVGTLALFGNDLAQHESQQTIGVGGWPFIASKRSGGGGNTDYGICYVDTSFTPYRVAMSLYEGRSPNGGFRRRSTGCGLGITPSGRPALNETITFALSNVGAEVSGLIFGFPAPATPLCANCSLGLDLFGLIVDLQAPASLHMPPQASFVGVTLSMQGFAFGSGACPGGLRMSDTIDFTIQ